MSCCFCLSGLGVLFRRRQAGCQSSLSRMPKSVSTVPGEEVALTSHGGSGVTCLTTWMPGSVVIERGLSGPNTKWEPLPTQTHH